MTFLHPAILAAGLLAVAIPVLIHFFMRRRRRPVPWAAMRFLVEAYRKRKRKLALEQLLLLAARCLLVALLGAAIAHPLLGAARAGSGPARLLIVLLDDSLTAQATDDAGEAELARSIALAAGAVNRLDPSRGDRAALITLGAPARAVVATPSADLAAVARAIEATRATDAPADVPGAAALARAMIEADQTPDVYVLVASGLHAGVMGARPELAPLGGGEGRTVRVAAAEPAPARANTAIASLTPARRVLAGDEPAGRLVSARLARFGPALSEQRTLVRLADARTERTLGESTLTWAPGERERTVLVPVELSGEGTPGAQRVLVATIASDALPADGTRRALVEMRRTIRVGIVARAREGAIGVGSFTPTDWLRAALDPGEGGDGGAPFEVSVIDPARVDPARLARIDAALVTEPDALTDGGWETLGAFGREGGLVVVTAPATGAGGAWADAMREALGTAWAVAPAAREADLALAPGVGAGEPALLGMIESELEYLGPPVRVRRVVDVASATPGQAPAGVLLALGDGAPLVLAHAGEGGRGVSVLVTAALDPEWTNLPTRPLFVPLVHELIRQGVGASRAGWETATGAPAPAPRGAVELVPAFDPARTGALGVSEAGVTREPVRTAGALLGLDEGGAARGLVVVNPPAEASNTDALPRGEVESWLGGLTPRAEIRWIERAEDAGPEPLAGAFRESDPGRPLAWIALAAALTLAMVECVLGRRSSHAEQGARA